MGVLTFGSESVVGKVGTITLGGNWSLLVLENVDRG
ncbi:hypothetical protein NIES23_09260 [Trichormus variabilis NIES-23]|uniref:Uncharacterized protein n=1 Tax=Trichormus variabilis NIES-23 TaxID=1973479 RepID=A0A1Z4KGP7_ANAVA|nr:hypothetical protein NIES23_09260 [Trichormus variabilis NIES-23]